MHGKYYAALASAALLAIQPGTAHAQIWIGLMVGQMMSQGQAAAAETACMNGTPMIEAEVAEARGPALQIMPAYFADAKAGAPIARHFNLDKKAQWSDGQVSVGMAGIDAQRDPFAQGGLVLDPAPLGLVRAGDGRTALGQWVARDASGAVAGTYTASFNRKSGVWRLSTLTLTPARHYADPVVQYCHTAGDVLPFRVANTRFMREYAEKRVKKAEERVQRIATARPNPETTERAAELAQQLADRRKELGYAQEAEAKALADNKAAEDARTAAIAALGGG